MFDVSDYANFLYSSKSNGVNSIQDFFAWLIAHTAISFTYSIFKLVICPWQFSFALTFLNS